MILVIGSGPAGVACASALLEKGAQVTMLDAGLELETDRRRRLADLRSVAFTSWDEDSLRFLREGVEVSAGGIPLKLAYGSQFPYRDPMDQPMTARGVHGKPSFARGGLSNVWGASVLPYRAADMSEWPITVEDLAPHYRAVLEMMPFSGRHDGLEKHFPLHHDHPGVLASSRQAIGLLHDLAANEPALTAHGVSFGVSRLALQAELADGQPGCVFCGKCIYGCPYEVIYNSDQSLEQLRTRRAFTYRAGVVVERLREIESQVEVSGHTLDDYGPFQIRADKVFLACGVLSTARVMLTSLDAFEHPIQAVDNCYFLLPLVRYRSQPDAPEEPLYTLAQVFIEVVDPAVGPQTAHLQVYTYNELYAKELRRLLGPLDRLLPPALRRNLLGRLLLIQGYLHSDLSARIQITLRRETGDRPATLELAAVENPRTRPALSALRRRLWAERSSMKAYPVSPALRVGEPGRGFHTGGTFPMRLNPTAFEVDVIGRPYGFSNVHVVDASVFPSLPATTITLSVMANAHRIGTSAFA
ncbi:MAG TPA: GMC oxidoreductase [Candidatus Dormibacteraeota bacterium]|nr:GMC oxidoreductase [Candidatus Dormibacteraeota bacterium]